MNCQLKRIPALHVFDPLRLWLEIPLYHHVTSSDRYSMVRMTFAEVAAPVFTSVAVTCTV